MAEDDFADQVAGVAALADPIRRELYRYVVAQGDPVSREQAAVGTHTALHTAKFHLDRLADEGLLDTQYKRLSGRRGPGAGRPAKVYLPSTRELSVTVPERHYELAGDLMAIAIEAAAAHGTDVIDALHRAAADKGRALGDQMRQEAGRRPSRTRVVDAARTTLVRYGYGPRRSNDTLALVNCPFRVLARAHRDLVCGMNLAVIEGMLERGSDAKLTARFDPVEGRCCVTLSCCP